MRRRALVFTAAVLISSAALAHHSFAMFDVTQLQTVRGNVKAIEWNNPHVWLWVVQLDGPAAAVTYAFETGSPAELSRFYGWSKTALKVGDKVTVDYAPLRSGKSGGALAKITLADGRVLGTPITHLLAPSTQPPKSENLK